MNSILITGGAGAFGQAFTEFLLKHTLAPRIVIYSRNEYNQHLMAERFKVAANRLRFMIGDVRDKDRLRRALEDVETVVHAAALKRIEAGHYNPQEVFRTNIGGSDNLIDAAHDAGVHKAILLSSDKAYQPISPYGISKLAAEFLFLNANNTRGNRGPIFAVCRYGNVWNSTGSVVPTWRNAWEFGRTARMTDPECTRFYMTMDQAIALVMETYQTMKPTDTKPRIPTLPAYQLADLAEVMQVNTETVGLPWWEKKHESMEAGNCSETARRMTKDELRQALDSI